MNYTGFIGTLLTNLPQALRLNEPSEDPVYGNVIYYYVQPYSGLIFLRVIYFKIRI